MIYTFPGGRLLVGVTAALSALATLAAADLTRDQVLAKMDQAAAHFKGLSANIQIVHHMDVIHEDDTQSGTILVKRPNRKDLHVKVTIEHPEQKIAVADKKEAKVYYPSSGDVQMVNMAQKGSMVDMILTLGFGGTSQELLADYDVTLGGSEAVAGENTTRLELIPKSQQMLAQWKRIDLWISDRTGYAVQQKFYEAGKDFNLITYTNLQPQTDIPDSAFNLNVPKGTKKDQLNKKK
ncbi:MAG TPA: outer membrane lipoprotein-sorting protein [Bryobacteraceae bacterium]|nr:outer membrane lipoprotein-sorting protein [Bryobacteraceae bacterium]